MKYKFYLLFLLWFVACSPGSPQSDVNTFDERARRFFETNLNRFDFAPMSNYDKCVLEQTVAKDLTALNDWRMVVFYDTFNIKTYDDAYLQLPFSFIENRRSGQFHFLWIPFLRDHLFNVYSSYYKSEGDSVYVLQHPLEAMKVPAELIDSFFNDPAFLVKDESSYYRHLHFARNLMTEVLPLISPNEIDVGSFESRMKELLNTNELQMANYRFIKEKLIDPMFTSEHHKLQTFYVENIGYILLVYNVDDRSQFKVNFYFVPKRRRHPISPSIAPQYRECFHWGDK